MVLETVQKTEEDIKNLSDQEKRIIQKAHENVDSTLDDIAERFDCSVWKIQNTLSKEVPEWYENVFKMTGKSLNSKAQQSPIYDSSNEIVGKVGEDDILSYIEENEYVYAQRLSDISEIDPSTATKKLKSMEKDGYLNSNYGYDEEIGAPVRKFVLADQINHEAKQSNQHLGQSIQSTDQSIQSVDRDLIRIEDWCEFAFKMDMSETLTSEIEEVMDSDYSDEHKRNIIKHLSRLEERKGGSSVSRMVSDLLEESI